jgi:hypothetical protein
MDNYINAIQLCIAGNKEFIKKGNSNDFEQDSWIHLVI